VAWIKMRTDLAGDPAVIGVAITTDLDEDMVVGKLHKFWSWADSQTADGNAPSVTVAWLDRYLGVAGFGKALIEQGWLVEKKNGISIPKFDEHMSESAKKRALTSKRAATHRQRKSNAPSVTTALPREDKSKRREEEPRVNTVVSDGKLNNLFKSYGLVSRGIPPIKSFIEPAEKKAILDDCTAFVEKHGEEKACDLMTTLADKAPVSIKQALYLLEKKEEDNRGKKRLY